MLSKGAACTRDPCDVLGPIKKPLRTGNFRVAFLLYEPNRLVNSYFPKGVGIIARALVLGQQLDIYTRRPRRINLNKTYDNDCLLTW